MRSNSRKPSLGYEITSLKWNTNEPSTSRTFYLLSGYQYSNLENCNVSLSWAAALYLLESLRLVYELDTVDDIFTVPPWISRCSLCSCYLGGPWLIAKDPSDATGSSMGYRHSLPATAESNFTQWVSNIKKAGTPRRLPPVCHNSRELLHSFSGILSLPNDKQKPVELKSS